MTPWGANNWPEGLWISLICWPEAVVNVLPVVEVMILEVAAAAAAKAWMPDIPG